MATDYGLDFAGWLDITASFGTVTGQLAVAHAVARRLVQPTGGLIDCPTYGWDVRQLLNGIVRPAAAESKIEQQCLADERVKRADVAVVFTPERNEVNISIALTTAEGPFAMTLNVSALTVELLLPNSFK